MNQSEPSRRILLRNVVTFGCGLCLSLALAPAVLAAAKKMSQSAAHYQASPKGGRMCGGCANFIAESKTCKLVDGSISADGWCNLWSKKA